MRFLRRHLVGLTVMALILSLAAASPASAQSPGDFEISGGWFFTQTGTGGGTGYAVTDDGGVKLWTFFRDAGGIARIGYPVSRRWSEGPFKLQAFQKAVLQWQPDGKIYYLNIYDRLSELGHDSWLDAAKSAPRPRPFPENEGQPPEVRQLNHLKLLDLNPAIRNKWYENAAWLDAYGYPTAYEDRGNLKVLRAQRAVLQQWMVKVDWVKQAGDVVISNGGDEYKEAGLVPEAARLPAILADARVEVTPTPVAAPTPSPAPTATPAPAARTNPKNGFVDVAVILTEGSLDEGSIATAFTVTNNHMREMGAHEFRLIEVVMRPPVGGDAADAQYDHVQWYMQNRAVTGEVPEYIAIFEAIPWPNVLGYTRGGYSYSSFAGFESYENEYRGVLDGAGVSRVFAGSIDWVKTGDTLDQEFWCASATYISWYCKKISLIALVIIHELLHHFGAAGNSDHYNTAYCKSKVGSAGPPGDLHGYREMAKWSDMCPNTWDNFRAGRT